MVKAELNGFPVLVPPWNRIEGPNHPETFPYVYKTPFSYSGVGVCETFSALNSIYFTIHINFSLCRPSLLGPRKTKRLFWMIQKKLDI